jgi:hypothetical protein
VKAFVGLLVLGALLAVLLVLPSFAAASSTSPVPQQPGSGACPIEPLIPGIPADYGALVILLQPGPSQGTTCGLPGGSQLVGDQIIVGLYTPNPVPNDTALIGVEEFTTTTVTVTGPGPNGTNVTSQETVQQNVVYSNASVSASPGQIQEFDLNVPPVNSQEELTITLLGATETVSIVVPGAGIPIPANYPQLLEHDFEFDIWVAIFFAVGVGLATAVRLRVRHVERIWPFGLVGMIVSIGFAAWAYGDYPTSAVVLGEFPEALVAAPILLAGMYLWLGLFPTEAYLYRIRYPVADLRDGEAMYDTKSFRLYRGPDGPEYIGRGGAGFTARLLGVRTTFDDKVLNPLPWKIHNRGFRSKRGDIYAEYRSWAEHEGGPKILEVVPPRTFWLPWRKKTRELIADYHKKALRDKVPAPSHVGFFLYMSPSRAFAAVTGRQSGQMAEAWLTGTLANSKVGMGFERLLVAYSHLKSNLRIQAIEWGNKLALMFRMAEDYPGSPIAMKAMEDLATRHEAAIMDERAWLTFLEQKVEEDRTPTDGGSLGAQERLLREVLNPVPPDLRTRVKRAAGGAE